MSTADKLHRQIDLLCALLRRRAPATFVELAAEVPGYAVKLIEAEAAEAQGDAPQANRTRMALMQAFERDKRELRAGGMAIETTEPMVPARWEGRGGDPQPVAHYALDRGNFFLPYLVLRGSAAAPRPFGDRTVPRVTVTDDQLALLVEAGRFMQATGDPLLASDAASALLKLASDAPVVHATPGMTIAPPRRRADPALLAALGDAVHHRHPVTFAYESPYASTSEHPLARRHVQPWGRFYRDGFWYVTGRDLDRGLERNFRVDRMTALEVDTTAPPFSVPDGFRLSDAARFGDPWQLGTAPEMAVTVRVLRQTGAARVLARHGVPDPDAPTCHQFRVRNLPNFLQQLLPLGRDARVEAPEEAVARLETLVQTIRERYERPAPALPMEHALPPRHEPVKGPAPAPAGTATHLNRLLLLLPLLSDQREHRFSELADATGIPPREVARLLTMLADREVELAGFLDPIQICLEADRVAVFSSTLRRPLRLTAREVAALELGLATLRTRQVSRSADAPPVPEGMSYLTAELFEATGALLVQLGDGGDAGASVPGADEVHLQMPGADQGDVLQACHAGVVHHQALRISYRKWASEAADDRTVHPYRLVANDGQLYLVARCLRSDGVKWFRVDRIEAATVRSERFAIPDDAALEALLREGRPDFTGASEQLTVRFTGESARVVAEREGVVCAGDGSLVRHFPLADRSWAVAFVLRFGEDAEALAPTSVREAILEQLSW